MNCHYSAHGAYKCAKPQTAPAKFSNVYFTEETSEERFGNDEEYFGNESEVSTLEEFGMSRSDQMAAMRAREAAVAAAKAKVVADAARAKAEAEAKAKAKAKADADAAAAAKAKADAAAKAKAEADAKAAAKAKAEAVAAAAAAAAAKAKADAEARARAATAKPTPTPPPLIAVRAFQPSGKVAAMFNQQYAIAVPRATTPAPTLSARDRLIAFRGAGYGGR